MSAGAVVKNKRCKGIVGISAGKGLWFLTQPFQMPWNKSFPTFEFYLLNIRHLREFSEVNLLVWVRILMVLDDMHLDLQTKTLHFETKTAPPESVFRSISTSKRPSNFWAPPFLKKKQVYDKFQQPSGGCQENGIHYLLPVGPLLPVVRLIFVPPINGLGHLGLQLRCPRKWKDQRWTDPVGYWLSIETSNDVWG